MRADIWRSVSSQTDKGGRCGGSFHRHKRQGNMAHLGYSRRLAVSRIYHMQLS